MNSDFQPVKFLIGVGGIYVSYMLYGIMQERIFSSKYQSNDGKTEDRFSHSFIILFIQCLFSFIVAHIVNSRSGTRTHVSWHKQLEMGAYNFLSMIGSNTALSYMSYPLQALFKSCKVLSVLIVGLIFGKTNYPIQQYVCGVIVSAGIIGFNLLESSKTGKETQFIGIALILASLFSDGMLAERQAEMRKDFNPSSFELMEMCSKWCAILSLGYGILFSSEGFLFVSNHYTALRDILFIGLLGCVGQIFIFFTIRNFGPVILALVTTTRKFFTVLTSILFFGHHIGPAQWGCVSLVLLGVSIELYESYNKKAHPKKSDGKGEKNKDSKKLKVKSNKNEDHINLISHSNGKDHNHDILNVSKYGNKNQSEHKKSKGNGKHSK